MGVPTVTAFEFDETALEVLKVKHFEGYSKEWAEFILMNRNNTSEDNVHPYDIVIGPIANDSVGTQIRRLMRGFQYYFGTEDAIKYLTRL